MKGSEDFWYKPGLWQMVLQLVCSLTMEMTKHLALAHLLRYVVDSPIGYVELNSMISVLNVIHAVCSDSHQQ